MPVSSYTPKAKEIKFKGLEDPVVKETYLDFEKAKYWISQGAILSDSIKRLFSAAGLIPEPPTKIPEGYNRHLHKEQFEKAKLYFRQKAKEDDE
eukprot:gene9502-1708_t